MRLALNQRRDFKVKSYAQYARQERQQSHICRVPGLLSLHQIPQDTDDAIVAVEHQVHRRSPVMTVLVPLRPTRQAVDAEDVVMSPSNRLLIGQLPQPGHVASARQDW